MKRIRLRSIYTKFILAMVSIIVISSTLSFAIMSGLMVQMLYNPIIDILITKIQEIHILHEIYEIPLNEIPSMGEMAYYDIAIYKDDQALLGSGLEISSEDLELAAYEPIVSARDFHTKNGIFVFSRVGYQWVVLRPEFNSDMFKTVSVAIRWVLLISVMISILLTLIVVKRIVKPIKKLNLATREVASGNFEVKVIHSGEDEMGDLVRNFNLMTQELKNIEYLRKDFVSSVSHEFKTPIASISGFAKVLKNSQLDELHRLEYTNIIIDEAERLSKLSSNLLRLSSLENQSIIDRSKGFELDEQIRRIILLLEPKWAGKSLDFELELDPVFFYGDEELLQNVWINLIDNAIKFSNPNEKLFIKTCKQEQFILVEITDYGMGMNESTTNRIFEKFFQGDSSHKSDGNGLGMSIVKRIVDLYSGIIQVQSTLGQGTTFIVKFPIKG